MKLSQLSRTFGLALSLSSLTPLTSALATFSPGPSYSVGIPSDSSISSSSTGDLYFQLSAPVSYQWVGLGIGEQMQGATVFIMYQDGNGNVTISGRDGGQGHVEPLVDTALMAGMTLLEGSGVVGGNMVANVHCTSAKLDSSATSSTSPWIAAWNIGSAVDSTDTSYVLAQHSPDNTRQFEFDLSAASISSNSNPFVSSASSPTNTASGSSPSSTSSSGSGSGSGSGSSSGSGSGSAVIVGPSPQTVIKYEQAHGIIMGTTVVLLFPFGAMYMRLGGGAWVHGALQVFSLCALVSGFGLGIKLAQFRGYLYKSTGLTHTVFGTVLISLFLIQPFLGILHHLQYRKTLHRAPVSYAHIWYGRILMLCGIINGGLGLKLAANTKKGEIAYGVVAGVVAVVYAVLVAFKRKGGPTAEARQRGAGEGLRIRERRLFGGRRKVSGERGVVASGQEEGGREKTTGVMAS